MTEGKAPFVTVKTGNDISYQQIELHHTIGEEIQEGSSFFRGEKFDGTVAEIPYGHDQFSKTNHFSKTKGESFRVDAVTGGKSDDAKKYEAFRKQYWKDRLKDFE